LQVVDGGLCLTGNLRGAISVQRDRRGTELCQSRVTGEGGEESPRQLVRNMSLDVRPRKGQPPEVLS